MEVVGSYLMDQVLKMQWLSDLCDHARGRIRFGRQLPMGEARYISHLRHHQDSHSALRDDLHHQLHSDYFPPERSKRILGAVQRGHRRQHRRCFAWHGDAVLRLLFYPAVHRVHARGLPLG